MEKTWQEKHKELWKELANRAKDIITSCENRTGEARGYQALEWAKLDIIREKFSPNIKELLPKNLCYACEEAVSYCRSTNNGNECDFCPLAWPGNKHCDDFDEETRLTIPDDNFPLYVKLVGAVMNKDENKVRSYCLEIANLKTYSTEECLKRGMKK